MKIILCSYFKFPKGDAGAIRHEKFAYMLHELNHEVLVVGLGAHCEFDIKDFNGVKYTSLREKNRSIYGKIKSRCGYWERLKRLIENYKPDVIIMDDLRPIVTHDLKRYCAKKKIKLVHDSVEWYSPEQFKLGALDLACINKNIVNRVLIDKSMNVISISSYLHNYYTRKKIKSVQIPIVLAEKDYCEKKMIGAEVQFMYAGQPGKKDNLHMVIEAFYLLNQYEKKNCKLHIVGCTKEQVISSGVSIKYIEKLGEQLQFYGRIPHEKVLEMLVIMDFTLLMRSPELRYAKAGFPTKVAESLSRSTPVISNITSDLALYLIDGYNALVVEEYSVNSLKKALERSLKLDVNKRAVLCKNALHVAKNKLDYKHFIDQLKNVL